VAARGEFRKGLGLWQPRSYSIFLMKPDRASVPLDTMKLACDLPAIPDLKLFETDGYAVALEVLSVDQVQSLTREITGILDSACGTRKVLDLPWCSSLADRLRSDPRLRPALPVNALAVQCTLFVKTAKNNWLVSLHQDLSIPVADRVESPQCSGWSVKEDGLFVQPPIEALRNVVALRLHLDDCNERNGALRVVPGSHSLGRLSASAASAVRSRCGEVSVSVPSGGVMIMRPLLLHASSKSSSELPRRVLHFVFGPPDLPVGLRWPNAVNAEGRK
jgi:hypothetical protein